MLIILEKQNIICLHCRVDIEKSRCYSATLMSRVTATRRYIFRFYVMLEVGWLSGVLPQQFKPKNSGENSNFATQLLIVANVDINAYEVAIQVPMVVQIFQ